MSEILILSRGPMIITKDKAWFDNFTQENIKRRGSGMPNEGRVVLLPEDAILVSVPEVINREVVAEEVK